MAKKKGDNTLKIPRHIGIIMDGNGRWAKKRGLPRNFGHRQGAKAFENAIDYCGDLGIKYATFYAFSTENWKRPKKEIDGIISLLHTYIKKMKANSEKNVRIVFIGDLTVFDEDIRKELDDIQAVSKDNTGITIIIALNYGGKQDIIHGIKKVSQDITQGKISVDSINETMFASYLYTGEIPDVDLILRPSGEQRLSNFLIWQSAYAEFVFLDVLWPDFKKAHLVKALEEYSHRDRRFGGI